MNIYPQFLELLSAAIWNRAANPALFHNMHTETWNTLARYAAVQRVSALINDAVATLPPELKPAKSILIPLMLTGEKIENANRSLNIALKDISQVYDSKDFLFALLKGQGNALYYPNPLHRTPGDLDLFLYRSDDYQRAKQWIMNNGYRYEMESMHHIAFDFGNAHVENHFHVTYFTNEKYNKPLQKIIKEIVERDFFEIVEIDGLRVKVLPVEFNAFYVFEHLFHHFIHTGIGVRQVCDWLLLLSARRAEIDRNRLTALAKQFGLFDAMRALAHACVRHLNADPDIFPFELGEDSRYSELLMNDILEGGHFGMHRPKINTDSTWSGRWHRYKKSIKRSFVFGALAPSHIRVLPLTKLWIRIKITLKGA